MSERVCFNKLVLKKNERLKLQIIVNLRLDYWMEEEEEVVVVIGLLVVFVEVILNVQSYW